MALSLNPPPLKTPVDQAKALSSAWQRWFDSVQTVLSALIGSNGGQYINGVYGSFLSAASQTLSLANTPTKVTFDTSGVTNGISLASSKITVAVAGTYQLQYRAQIENTSATTANEAYVWARVNGADVANSASQTSAVATHGGVNGFAVQCDSLLLSLSANDYIELYWMGDATSLVLYHAAASGSPAVPSIPSVRVNLSLVSS